ncbi:hypothetical protein Droror1_Dr00010128 [Drosera rotundifolia]
MEAMEIRCRKCSLPVKTTHTAKKLRCPRCHAEIPLHLNQNGIQENNTHSGRQRENQDQPNRSSGHESSTNRLSVAASLSYPATRKRALICGVTYTNQKYELKGTINDARLMKDLLQKIYGFPEQTIRVLTEQPGTWPPTRKHMEEGMRWLVEGCQHGDSLVFYFSGHGLRQRDYDYDELDGYDETICPLDFATNGMILDNDINAMIVRPLVKGVKLHAIIDSCHSGTVLDLQHVYDDKLHKWKNNSPPNGANKSTKGGQAICLSACQDDQLAVDTTAFMKNQMIGAMTYCFQHAVQKNPGLSYLDLLDSMEETMSKAYESRCISAKFFNRLLHRQINQETQLSSSQVFDVNDRFTL